MTTATPPSTSPGEGGQSPFSGLDRPRSSMTSPFSCPRDPLRRRVAGPLPAARPSRFTDRATSPAAAKAIGARALDRDRRPGRQALPLPPRHTQRAAGLAAQPGVPVDRGPLPGPGGRRRRGQGAPGAHSGRAALAREGGGRGPEPRPRGRRARLAVRRVAARAPLRADRPGPHAPHGPRDVPPPRRPARAGDRPDPRAPDAGEDIRGAPAQHEDPPGGPVRAVVQSAPGGPETLSIGQVPDPDLGPGEVLVAVSATAINRADTIQRRGFYPPPPGASDIMGLEAMGRVVALGPGVHGVEVGRRVMALVGGAGVRRSW